MHYDIDGELAVPDHHATWSCPACRNTRVDEQGRLASLTCAGDPLTGATHSPRSMTRMPVRSTAPDGLLPHHPRQEQDGGMISRYAAETTVPVGRTGFMGDVLSEKPQANKWRPAPARA